MKNLLILLSLGALASCGSWGSYMATGVNKYGTRYVVTQEGDTIFREEIRTGGFNTWSNWGSPYIRNPYWNNNVWGPRIIIGGKKSTRTKSATSRGSKGRSSSGNRPVRGNRGGKSTQ